MARKDGKDRGLFQRPGDPAWWIRWACRHGHEYREKIGPKALAKAEYQKRRVAVRREDYCLTRARAAQRHAQPVLLREVAPRYLAWAQEHRPRSYTFREKALAHLTTAFGMLALGALTPAHLEDYQKQRREAGADPATVNRERAVLSHLFRKAMDWGLVTRNPVAATEPLVEPAEKPRPLTAAEEAQLLTCLPQGKRAWPYWRALVGVAVHTGLRLNELRQQRWEDIDLAQGTLTVTQPKSGQLETLPLNSVVQKLLASLEQQGPRVFPTLPRKASDLFVRYATKAGLTDVTLHCLRDTYISRLAPRVSTPSLMALARHRDYRTTRRYVRVDEAHLRAAVEGLASEGTGTQTGTADSANPQARESEGGTKDVE